MPVGDTTLFGEPKEEGLKKTRGDIIRGMSDDELAVFIDRISDCHTCPAMNDCKNSMPINYLMLMKNQGHTPCIKDTYTWLTQEGEIYT